MSKILDVSEKQLLRGYTLRIASLAEPLGAGVEVITVALNKEGIVCNKEAVIEACNYLESKGLVMLTEVKNEVLGIYRLIAKISAKGIDFLEGTITEDGIQIG